MRFLVLLLLSLSMSSLFHGTDSSKEAPLSGEGGFQPIKNLTDPHIVDIAKFAVSEHNKENKTNLIFQRIVSGKYQVVAGTNYVLVIEAKIGAAKLSRYYEAKVYENLSMKLQLIYFKPLLRQKKPPVSEDPSPLPGGYQDIKNLTDPHIQHIAKFAVSEHNKESKTNLIFKTIVSGKYQVVAGKNYVLVIEVKDGQYLYRYETKVFENLKMNLQLIYFKKDLGPLSAWKPVENLEKDKHILEIARNAVLEHNKELAKANKYNDDHHDAGALVFEKVVSGETQEVGDHEGVKYRLVISANGAKYEVSVWEKITSFKPLP